jgi:diketogulonate reductase-like aldo/keto reductase
MFYGRSEGKWLGEDRVAGLGLRERLFLATKVWYGPARRAGLAPRSRSLRGCHLRSPKDRPPARSTTSSTSTTQLETLRSLESRKDAVRYIGVSHYARIGLAGSARASFAG